MPKSQKKSKEEKRSINLALQGGGSHGAFAWGVLDYLLEDGRVDIEGICATSAGTMNACALAAGMQAGGSEKARESLHDFWWNIHKEGLRYNPVRRLPWERMSARMSDHMFGHFLFETVTRFLSPYQYNPFDINPLRDVLQKSVNFDDLKQCKSIKLFISATNVRSGKIKVFKTKDVTLDVAMASACLPFMFKAVSVKDQDYWDGGYMGNPALFPLFYETKTRDVLIVHINPIERSTTPKDAADIMNRINEISFNSSLLSEMRAIAFVKKLIEHDMLKESHKKDFKNVLVHSIRTDEALADLLVASKFDTDWGFLISLRDKGRAAMKQWLKGHFKDLGERDTVDLHQEFLHSNTTLFEDEHGNHRHYG